MGHEGLTATVVSAHIISARNCASLRRVDRVEWRQTSRRGDQREQEARFDRRERRPGALAGGLWWRWCRKRQLGLGWFERRTQRHHDRCVHADQGVGALDR